MLETISVSVDRWMDKYIYMVYIWYKYNGLLFSLKKRGGPDMDELVVLCRWNKPDHMVSFILKSKKKKGKLIETERRKVAVKCGGVGEIGSGW